jgi:hypothetical protein
MAIILLFFSVIRLSENRILDLIILETLDYRISDQGLNLSDYRILDSQNATSVARL